MKINPVFIGKKLEFSVYHNNTFFSLFERLPLKVCVSAEFRRK
jgi:hypothetical protein